MKAYIVWRGHRDYEQNLVVCTTRERAWRYATENDMEIGGKAPRGGFDNSTAVGFTANREPWGIEEREFLT